MTMQILRHRGLDERRAREIGTALMADDRNVDSSISNTRIDGSMHVLPYAVVGVRAVDGVVTLDHCRARHEAAPLIAQALEASSVQRSGAIDPLAEAIRQAVLRSPRVAGLPIGTQITVLCGTPWSNQEVLCHVPGQEAPIVIDVPDVPQAAEAGLSMRILNIARFQWIGRIVEGLTTPTVDTESAGVW